MEITEVIRRGRMTEKAVRIQEPDKFQASVKPAEKQTRCFEFEVALKANKIEIRRAVESLFDVTVLSVNTARMPGKKRNVRSAKSARVVEPRPWKKAFVTIPADQSIDVLKP